MKKLAAALAILLSACSTVPETCVAVKPKAQARAMELWSRNSELWPKGAVLRVKFLDGTASQQRRAWFRFQKVDELVNLKFIRIPGGEAEIRVAFDQNGGHWSYVGKWCLRIPQSQPTMNLALRGGVFADRSEEWDRVAIHEVLHSIGFQHEHQSPQSTIKWNLPVVREDYRRTQGWTYEETDYQVINRADARDFNGSAFDPQSIMLYPIPKEHTLDGFKVGWNRKLSPTDIATLRRIYPK